MRQQEANRVFLRELKAAIENARANGPPSVAMPIVVLN